MPEKRNLRYSIHIPIITCLLVIQFFAIDLFSPVFLSFVERGYERTNVEGTLYRKGEYTPLSQKISSDYALVFVRQFGQEIIEIYYLNNGTRIKAKYKNSELKQREFVDFGNIAYFLIPILGLLLIIISLLHKMFRTGAVTTFTSHKHPFNATEIRLLIYGIPLFISAIIFGWLGRL